MTEEELKRKLIEYEKRMGIGEYDPAKEGYLVLVDILRQQTEYLKEFKIKSKISSEEKSDIVEYKNAKDLWEGLPDSIKSVRDLKIELKMEGEEKKSTYVRASAKSIADGTASM
jgi:hypothetical protein